LETPSAKSRSAVAPLIFSQKQASSAFALAFLLKTPTRKSHASIKAKSFCYLLRPQLNKISNKNDFAFPACHQNGLSRRQPLPRKKKLFLPPPAARGEKAARDVEKTYMFFSSIRFEARHGVKRGEIACLQ